MTFKEAENFYKQDEKKYDIENNKEFLKWFKDSIKKGYHYFNDIEDLQQLIDNITTWYEMKYPERELEFYEGVRYFNFKNMLPLSRYMNIEQLLYRLPHDQLLLLECSYRAGAGYHCFYNVNGEKTCVDMIGISIYKKDNFDGYCEEYHVKSQQFLLSAEEKTGKVDVDTTLKKYVNNDSINLEEVLDLFKTKYNDILDFKELEDCIYDHNCDFELRNKILQLVALKLLYSSKTIPERGYIRATRFIDEFNKKLGLNLSKNEIDEIMNRIYKIEDNKTKIKNRII